MEFSLDNLAQRPERIFPRLPLFFTTVVLLGNRELKNNLQTT